MPVIRSATRVSKRGAEFIARFEGGASEDGLFRPYRDAVGVWTIGFGHTEGVNAGSRPLTRAQATALLRKDLDAKYGAAVKRLLHARGIRVSQKQFNALVSIVYNVGPGILEPGRSLGDALRASRVGSRRARWRKEVGDAFLLYDKAGGRRLAGLTRRRAAERALWMGGRYA